MYRKTKGNSTTLHLVAEKTEWKRENVRCISKIINRASAILNPSLIIYNPNNVKSGTQSHFSFPTFSQQSDKIKPSRNISITTYMNRENNYTPQNSSAVLLILLQFWVETELKHTKAREFTTNVGCMSSLLIVSKTYDKKQRQLSLVRHCYNLL